MGFFSKLAIATFALTACQSPAYPVSPGNAETQAKSVFKVQLGSGGSGTAWVWKNEEGPGSYLITAGHVCDDEDTFTLVSRDGTEYHAYKIMESSDPDLCELHSPATVGPPLLLADALPAYNEPVVSIGAPAGYYGDGQAPIYHGWYAGGSMVVGPVFPGISGGPVISKGGVIGVMVRGVFQANLGFFVPLQTIKDWLEPKDVLP